MAANVTECTVNVVGLIYDFTLRWNKVLGYSAS